MIRVMCEICSWTEVYPEGHEPEQCPECGHWPLDWEPEDWRED